MTALSRSASLLPDKWFVRAIAHAHKRFEPELGRVVASCPSNVTALDVGAWYGPWTFWLSRRVRSVVAFEPNPDVADVLERTLRPNVTLIRAAASSEPGVARLTVPKGGRGTEGRASLEGLADSDQTVDVSLCRIDSLDVADVGLLKIDVEGHEREALIGAEQLLHKWKPLLVVEIEERHGGVAPTVELLASWGYRGRVLVDGRWVSLDDFDLIAHQDAHLAQQRTGSYLQTVTRRTSRYINNVVFTHPATRWSVD